MKGNVQRFQGPVKHLHISAQGLKTGVVSHDAVALGHRSPQSSDAVLYLAPHYILIEIP